MTAAFGTSTDRMLATAGRVETVDADIRTRLAGLRTAVEAVRASWQGEAAATFQALMLRWDEDAQRLSRALADIADQVRSSGRDYAETDRLGHGVLRTAGSGLAL